MPLTPPTTRRRRAPEPLPSIDEVASHLAYMCKRSAAGTTESLSVGGSGGHWMVLVALTPKRVEEVEHFIRTIAASGGVASPVERALRARIAELEESNRALTAAMLVGTAECCACDECVS